jgi:hypothetical protein
MQFAVVPVCVWGRPLARREIANLRPVTGDLRVEYLLDRVRLRHLRVARLVDGSSPIRRELLPMLLDVQLVAMSPGAFTLAGLERIDGAEYAQAWIASVVDAARGGTDNENVSAGTAAPRPLPPRRR